VVEAVARAIYDAPDTQSGDTIGTVIWNSDHLFYETQDGEEIVDRAWRVCAPVCRDAAKAAIAAMGVSGEVERLREALSYGTLSMTKSMVVIDYDSLERAEALFDMLEARAALSREPSRSVRVSDLTEEEVQAIRDAKPPASSS
jgi:hypothetical protein